jgi:serine/threonine-protein kinase
MESISPSLLKRAIDVCDRFEADWRANCCAPIEHYLGPVSAEERQVVLKSLLALEVELRRARGERPTQEEYERRFPQATSSILSAFGTVDSDLAPSTERETDHTPDSQPSTIAEASTLPDELATTACADRAGEPGTPHSAEADRASHRDRTDSTQSSSEQSVVMPADQGVSLDRYVLIRIHAKGGIGEVWLARDSHLGREIALKRLQRATTLHPHAQARFLREARVTGQLQHPGIAPVYELSLGAKEQEPFYTMRLIKGRTLTEAAREYHRKRTAGLGNSLDLRELVGAFHSACLVIAYAHSRGVIHRDIKGRNVVLGDYGEVVVLDWGLAKIVGEKEETPCGSAENSSLALSNEFVEGSGDETAEGEILGTPSYMSPEQAMGRPELVNQRTDIYGLGAILYEILTGEPPFRGEKYKVLRKVLDEQPEPPRHRVAGTSLALEAICLKCLAKEPGDRYASAGQLASDVQRYLADEPVTAFVEPMAVKVRRWIGRHRTLAIASTASLGVATVILSAATIFLGLANKREAEQHAKAEEYLKLAKSAVDSFVTDFGEDPRMKAHGLERPRQRLLLLAKKFYEIFAREQGQEPTVEAERAKYGLQLAKLTEELGEAREALPLSQQSCSIFEALSRKYPDVQEYRVGFARAQEVLGGNYWVNRQPTEAKRAFDMAATAWEHLSKEYPASSEFRYRLAAALNRLGKVLGISLRDVRGAKEALGRSLSICESLAHEHPDKPEYQNEQAEVLLQLGISESLVDFEKSRGMLEAAVILRETLATEHPEVLEYQSTLVATCMSVATTYSNARVSKRVHELYENVRRISERLASEHPDIPQFAENRCLIEMLLQIDLALAGEHVRAVASAAEIAARVPWSGSAMLYAASCFAVASEAALRDRGLSALDQKRQAERYLDRAMDYLRAAQKTGIFDQPYFSRGLRTDPDLAPLRKRDDFKKLVDEVDPTSSQ